MTSVQSLKSETRKTTFYSAIFTLIDVLCVILYRTLYLRKGKLILTAENQVSVHASSL